MATIKIPFKPRSYQIPLINFILNGGKRAFIVWHRRAGKDLALWNFVVRIATQEKGLYFYFLPTYTQGKKIIWDGITNDGFRFLDFCPKQIVRHLNGQEMKIELANGSIIQIIGTDNYDSIRGTNPRGCVFSEYAYQNPQAWEVVKPILRLNVGWAVFNTTPQGENHAYELYSMAENSDEWYTNLLTVDDTGLLTKEDIDKERAEGMSEEMIQQEYYCSWSGSLVGSYYGQLMDMAKKEKRLTRVPYEPTLPVYTSWDLGMDDQTAIWFFQVLNLNEIRVIDYYENNGESLSHYAGVLFEKGYTYRDHLLPHDVEVRELSSGKSRRSTLESLKIRPITVCPAVNPADRIQGTRNMLPKCYFDKDKCAGGVRALKGYRKEYDEKKKTYKPTPLHDWASHGADAFGQFAINFVPKRMNRRKKAKKFNPYAPI